MQQTDGGVQGRGLVVRPVRHQRVKVVDGREDARAERDLFGLEAGRVPPTVPPFVMAQDERHDGIREGHAADDFRADLRMNADLLELFLGERARFGQDVLGHGELADVVQQRGGLDALDLGLGHAERPRKAGRVHLDAPDVALRRLIFRVDGEGQCLDGRQMQIGHLLHVQLLILNAAHVDLVRPVNQIHGRGGEQRHPVAAAFDDGRRDGGGAGAEEVARRTPEEVLVPDSRDRLLRRQPDRRRDECRIAHEVGGRRTGERLGNRQKRVGDKRRRSAKLCVHPARRFHGEHERRHAEDRPEPRTAYLGPERALAPGAGAGHEHCLVGAEQQQRGEVDTAYDTDIVEPPEASGRLTFSADASDEQHSRTMKMPG